MSSTAAGDATAVAIDPKIRRIDPKTKEQKPNGIPQHGFLSFAVAHPRREEIKISIPNTI